MKLYLYGGCHNLSGDTGPAGADPSAKSADVELPSLATKNMLRAAFALI